MLDKSISFLINLDKNNTREWFLDNKQEYEEAKIEFENFTNVLIARIAEFDSEIKMVDAKKSIFRIYRDTRFAKDKTPYKTNFGAYLVSGGRKSPLAGYYLHLEPTNKSFAGGGVHCPQPNILKAIRSEIYQSPSELKNIVESKEFIDSFGEIAGDKLKTAPKGFPKDFSEIQLLRYKSYAQVYNLETQFFKKDHFLDDLTEIFQKAKILNDYLNTIIREEI